MFYLPRETLPKHRRVAKQQPSAHGVTQSASHPIIKMDTIFQEFGEAFSQRNGYQLSQTLTPELPNDMLRAIFRSTNHHEVRHLLKRGIQSSVSISPLTKISHDEVQGWVEVFLAYWKATGELLAVQDQSAASSSVSLTLFLNPSLTWPIHPVSV